MGREKRRSRRAAAVEESQKFSSLPSPLSSLIFFLSFFSRLFLFRTPNHHSQHHQSFSEHLIYH